MFFHILIFVFGLIVSSLHYFMPQAPPAATFATIELANRYDSFGASFLPRPWSFAQHRSLWKSTRFFGF
jgi:hypothetical protein